MINFLAPKHVEIYLGFQWMFLYHKELLWVAHSLIVSYSANIFGSAGWAHLWLLMKSSLLHCILNNLERLLFLCLRNHHYFNQQCDFSSCNKFLWSSRDCFWYILLQNSIQSSISSKLSTLMNTSICKTFFKIKL